MNLLKRIARRILRDEIRQLEGRARQAEFYFGQWRKAAMLWERYARQLRVDLPTAPSFEEFFWALPVDEAKNPEKYHPNIRQDA